ncbi:MAG TPA: hypothetical protein VLA88_03715 [Candidatus Saccharimonadales bacterium]|nr:hypothetical protein [Candidatus Saccharimonadales bacterium]
MSWLSSFFGTSETRPSTSPEGATAVDVITYLASLASNPREIDPILDRLREVTVRQGKNTTLTEADQAALAEVFQQLLRYLVEREPLRAFTREEILAKVHGQFKPAPTETVFWGKAGL